jgi:hypothetical protein
VPLGIPDHSGIYENLEVTICDHLISKFRSELQVTAYP